MTITNQNLTGSPELLPLTNWAGLPDGSHFVQFYDNDAFLVQSVREFIKPGDVAIIIATPEHRARLEEDLQIDGLELPDARAQGRYIALDSADTLNLFMLDGLPDSDRFFEYLGGLIIRASVGRSDVRIFGEMVAQLWAEGNQAGAIRLEQLWNDLSRMLSFNLCCGYPLNDFQGDAQAEAFSQICGQHSGVLPTESYALLESADERLREIALLQQKARSLEAEIEQRRKAEHQKDELIGIISHELKTPVTSVKGYTQILQKRFRKTEDMHSAALVTKMEAQLNKLIGLISELVDATRIEGGKLQFNPLYFDFNELVLEIVEQMQFTTEKHQIVVSLAETKMIWADKERVGQVISNFISNAVKYSPPSTEIQVTTWLDPVNITLRVQDCGIGVPAEDQTRIFERFYRVSGEGRETYPGLGLGLYISSEIIRRHQGRIWVDSQTGKGSQFAFSLPLKPDSLDYE
jgi:signal transduction histidine kinase